MIPTKIITKKLTLKSGSITTYKDKRKRFLSWSGRKYTSRAVSLIFYRGDCYYSVTMSRKKIQVDSNEYYRE
jgi:hypothetical protein